jgi:hypothetical protein
VTVRPGNVVDPFAVVDLVGASVVSDTVGNVVVTLTVGLAVLEVTNGVVGPSVGKVDVLLDFVGLLAQAARPSATPPKRTTNILRRDMPRTLTTCRTSDIAHGS